MELEATLLHLQVAINSVAYILQRCNRKHSVPFWFPYLGTVYISQALQLTEAWFILVSTSPPQPHFSCIYVVNSSINILTGDATLLWGVWVCVGGHISHATWAIQQMHYVHSSLDLVLQLNLVSTDGRYANFTNSDYVIQALHHKFVNVSSSGNNTLPVNRISYVLK